MLLRLLRAQLRPYRVPIAIVVLLQLVQTLATLYLPTLNAQIIDNGVITGNTGYIMRTGGVMIAVTIVQVLASIGAVYFGARTAMAMGRDVRQAVFTRVHDFSARDVARFGAPSLITRTTNDVQQVQMLAMMTFTMMVSAPIMCVGGIVLALDQNVELSSLLLVAVPALGVIVGLIITRMRPLFRAMQDRLDEINRVLREQITGVRVVRAFVRDDLEQERFAGASTQLMNVSLGVGRLMALMFPAVMVVLNFSSVAVLWFGGHLVASGSMQIGQLTAFLSYLMQILIAVMMATFMFVMVPRAEVCAERIVEVLDTEPDVVPPASPVGTAAVHGYLELADVEFRYPGAAEPVLRGISLAARPGEITAVIGGTGSGKTTLLNLIPRLFDATGGAVLVDGVNVRDLDPAVLSAAVGFVPQKPYLFSGTVGSNLRYGKPGRHRCGTLAGAGDRAGPRFRRADGRRPGREDRARRHQCLRWPAPAAGYRPRARAPSGDLPVRRLVLGAGLRDGRRAAGRARGRDRGGDGRHRRAAGRHHQARRPHHGAGGGPGNRHRHALRADGHQ